MDRPSRIFNRMKQTKTFQTTLVVLLSLLSFRSFAADEKAPFYDYNGTARLYQRYVEQPGHDQNKTQAQLRMDGFLNLTSDGCFKLAGRLATGKAYNSEGDDTGLGNEDYDMHLNLRHMYIDSQCFEKFRIQFGAMPTTTSSGTLGLANTGWIDGAKISYSETEKNRVWNVVVGEVDEFNSPNVFSRSFHSPNNYKLEVIQNFEDQSKVTVSASRFEDQSYLRWVIEKALHVESQFLAAHQIQLQKIQLEQITADTDHLGALAQLNSKVGMWGVNLAVAHLEPKPSREVKANQTFKTIYGTGMNYIVELERPFARHGRTSNYYFYTRVRQGDAGLRTDVGIAHRFKKK